MTVLPASHLEENIHLKQRPPENQTAAADAPQR